MKEKIRRRGNWKASKRGTKKREEIRSKLIEKEKLIS